jgi:AcrR family transcriptional regulator
MSSQTRTLAGRRADTVGRLLDAATIEVAAVTYDGLTVRNVARRAGVAPATAYTYFSSKDHLVAEVFWRRLEAISPAASEHRVSVARRVSSALGDVSELVAREPELARACTVALMSSEPDVVRLRDRIGGVIHRRLADALGEDADPSVLDALDLAFSGALVRAGTGNLSYEELGERMGRIAEVVTR